MGDHVEHCKPDLESLRAQAIAQGDAAVLNAINDNTALLQQLFDRLQHNGMLVEPESAFEPIDQASQLLNQERAQVAIDDNIRLIAENNRLGDRIKQLEQDIDSLRPGCAPHGQAIGRRQDDLRQDTPAAVDPQSLTWEQRKQQIIQQLENECLDSQAFVAAAGEQKTDPVEPDTDPLHTAIRFVEELCEQKDRLHEAVTQNELELECQIREIESLKDSLRLLQAQLTQASIPIEALVQPIELACQGCLPLTAEPISERIIALLDDDEIIQAERENLLRLQEACEQKLREIEIRTSLERARHSRQQTELEQKTRGLENQLNELQRELAGKDSAATGTRWMRKLGLSGGSKD